MAVRHVTAAERTEALRSAGAAARRLHKQSSVLTEFLRAEAEVAATNLVNKAMDYGITSAEIAVEAGLPQVRIAVLIRDDRWRASALRSALHDAERYVLSVSTVLRADVVRTVNAGMDIEQAEKLYGVDADTIWSWVQAACQHDFPADWNTAISPAGSKQCPKCGYTIYD